jgi:SAM-dependent methyltransferase
VTPEQLAALEGDRGRALFAAIGSYRAADALATAARLRASGEDPDLVAAALTQARLRTRAVERLGPEASGWWFTPDGAEQATRPEVAARRAARLAAAGLSRIADLGCGIGADTIALARAGLRVVAVEVDPLTAAIAAANTRAAGVADQVDIRCVDLTALTLGEALAGVDAVFLDPARRAGGRRITEPEAWSPPWSFVCDLAQRVPTVTKVAPGIAHDLPPAGAEAEWVSVGGDLVEACVWFAPLADPQVRRRAVLLPSDAELTDVELPAAAVGALGGWLMEPDDAIIRAGLVARVAADVEGRLLDRRIAYVTCDAEPLPSPRYRRFRVLEAVPFSVKRIRERMRAFGAATPIVKKRGMAIDPDDLRRRLRSACAGSRPLTVLLTRVGDDPVAIIAEAA